MTNGELVDLRSDTLTKPTDAMRDAMAQADVGDDVFGEDPTVNALQERCAKMLGKEAGLFVPSGTMANLLAFMSQTKPGDTVILNEDAHPYKYESGNLAALGGLVTRTLKADKGILTKVLIEPYIATIPDAHFSPIAMVSVENTTNAGGGNIYSLKNLKAIRALSDKHAVKVHMDGARLFNAVVGSVLDQRSEYIAKIAQCADSVSFCFSKGLGAPVGSILVGSAETIDTALRYRKMVGGGMRQAGILAAAANYALDHHVDRLVEDHLRAKIFREELEEIDGISFPMENPTNIVFFEVENAVDFCGRIGEQGVLMIPMGPTRIRAVFHLDVDDKGMDQAIKICREALK
jgi:threonine aldolase